jgi:hypothetical protein
MLEARRAAARRLQKYTMIGGGESSYSRPRSQEHRRLIKKPESTLTHYGLRRGDLCGSLTVEVTQTAHEERSRHEIYNQRISCSGYHKTRNVKIFRKNVANGGAQATWKALNSEFDTNTLAEYKDLMDHANQAALGQALGEFISKLI